MPSPYRPFRLGALALPAALGLLFVACIDEPRLSTVDATGANGPGARGNGLARSEMVFVPGVAIDLPGSTSPPSSGQGEEGNGNGNGNGKGGKKDAGAPAPTPSPEAGATTSHLDVAGFWIDVHEVTVDSFRACIAAGGCTPPAAGAGCTMDADLAAHPVNCVTLEQARGFCAWQTKRLVGNHEWTAAAMGNGRRPYPWGTELPAADRLNACGAECAAAGMYAGSDGHVRTAPTGAFPLGRTPDGVDDLAGNVAEWVEGGLLPTARGGSFEDVDVASVRSLEARAVEAASATVGFRCAADH